MECSHSCPSDHCEMLRKIWTLSLIQLLRFPFSWPLSVHHGTRTARRALIVQTCTCSTSHEVSLDVGRARPPSTRSATSLHGIRGPFHDQYINVHLMNIVRFPYARIIISFPCQSSCFASSIRWCSSSRRPMQRSMPPTKATRRSQTTSFSWCDQKQAGALWHSHGA